MSFTDIGKLCFSLVYCFSQKIKFSRKFSNLQNTCLFIEFATLSMDIFFFSFFLKTKSELPSFTYLQNAEADTPSAKDKLCFVGTKPMLYLEEEKVYSAVPL